MLGTLRFLFAIFFSLNLSFPYNVASDTTFFVPVDFSASGDDSKLFISIYLVAVEGNPQAQ